MAQLKWAVFATPKQGNTPDQYEDAWAVDAELGHLAVADGATESFASRTLASLLVTHYVRQPPIHDPDNVLEWLKPLAAKWHESIPWDSLAWYTRAKAEQGAFAALLGISFTQQTSSDELIWNAMAIGDVCMFQVRDNHIITSFPITHSNLFGSTPPLLATLTEYSRRSLTDLCIASGKLQHGDLLLICTDAIAAWFLQRAEQGSTLWIDLQEISEETMCALIDRERSSGSMRNDDVTVLAAQLIA
jgi:hypothetical protein